MIYDKKNVVYEDLKSTHKHLKKHLLCKRNEVKVKVCSNLDRNMKLTMQVMKNQSRFL